MIPAPDKRFATAQAQAALRGIILVQIDGDFGQPVIIATLWALTRQFDTIDEVESWLEDIETGSGVES